MGMDPAAVSLAVNRLSFGVGPIDDAIIASQQSIADVFSSLDLIPNPITVSADRPPDALSTGLQESAR